MISWAMLGLDGEVENSDGRPLEKRPWVFSKLARANAQEEDDLPV